MPENLLRIGLPKGSLQEATVSMFEKAGWQIRVDDRGYAPDLNDDELWAVLLRAQEMPTYVADGYLDCGLTGLDWIKEREVEDQIEMVADLVYAKRGMRPYKWVLAVHEQSSIQSVNDLEGGSIATELVSVTEAYLATNGVHARVEYSWGATEAKCPALVDAIVEGTETGSTLRANNLRIIDTLFESTTKFIVNKQSWQDDWKRQKIETITLMLQGALAAEHVVGLKMNVAEEDLAAVCAQLPALKQPTLSPLAGNHWVALEVVVDKNSIRVLVPKLKAAGAQGIIEYPLNKLIM